MNAGVIIGLLAFGGWLTHIFTCFAEGLWGFLIAGAIMFPIGILHGWWLWFGFQDPRSDSTEQDASRLVLEQIRQLRLVI